MEHPDNQDELCKLRWWKAKQTFTCSSGRQKRWKSTQQSSKHKTFHYLFS